MIDRVEFAVACWLTIGAIALWLSIASMVKVDWREVRRWYRRWRDSR